MKTANSDREFFLALIDALEIRYDDPRPPDNNDGGLTQIAKFVIERIKKEAYLEGFDAGEAAMQKAYEEFQDYCE